VGLVLEGIYRDGTNSIATHAWTGGKLPLFAAVKGTDGAVIGMGCLGS
tara:strand:- start:76 stop:219 length:144 start_codon:yes stop_codon:yes gene_type:complete